MNQFFTRTAQLALLGSALALTACGSGNSNSASLPDTAPAGASGSTSSGTGSTSSTGGSNSGTSNALGTRCAGGATGAKYCIGLKYITFEDTSGAPSATQATVVSNVAAMNQIWSTCSINFQLEDYESINPSTNNLSTNGDTTAEMNAMRTAFVDNTHFLIVSLWGTVAGADAWTEEAGSGSPYGTILDYNVVTYVPVIAHEMGHYMGLEHVSDTSNLMDPTPYEGSTLDASQCATAVSTIQQEWTAMLR